MSNVVKLERKPEWLFSVAVYKNGDGTIRAEIADASKAFIEGSDDPGSRVLDAAMLVEMGLPAMKAEAAKIGRADDDR